MSLRINTIIRKIPQIILWLVLLFVAGCLVKVAIWEHNYYKEKEGSRRAPAQEIGVSSESEDVDETEITADQIYAHTVSPDKPRYLSIPKLNVHNARIFEVGLTASGAMATRANIFDIGWYGVSSKPGQGGTLLMNGHNGGPTKVGVFKYLGNLDTGDPIIIERGDGVLFTYQVVENRTFLLAEANAYMATMQTSPIPGVESISLITCSGEWSQSQRTYLSRTMVRATLVPVIHE